MAAMGKGKGKLRTKLIERDGPNCHLCGLPTESRWGHWAATIDHLIPQSKGGKHTLENLRLAHFLCNVIRGNWDITDEVRAECRKQILKADKLERDRTKWKNQKAALKVQGSQAWLD